MRIYKNIVAAFSIFCFINLIAQPSGGPYGPIGKVYQLPDDANKIFYVSMDGDKNVNGESLSAPTTIENAISKARTGDAIILRGGIYRTGNLIINQGVLIQPYLDEKTIFKGTFIADKWENLGNGLWTTKWKHLFPSKPDNWWRRNREGKKTPLYKFNNDMVFVDGKFLHTVAWEGEVDENTFFIDYDSGTVYIGVDPTNKVIEITAFDVAILRTTKELNGIQSDSKGYKIKGIIFTQYAYRALEIEGTDPEGLSPETEHGKKVIGTTLEDCTISYCSRVAGYFRGDNFVMRNCLISDTSTEGVYLLSSNDALLEKNIFRRNNIENITGYYPAAVKIFNQCYRVTCNDNLVTEQPNSNGIWYDVGNVDGVFTNNWIENVGNNSKEINPNQLWPSDNGFFFEISKGVTCVGNVFVNCDHGLMILNSSDAKIYNNTFINSMACIGRNERSAAGDHFGWHPSTGPDVDERIGHEFINNVMYGDENFKRPFVFVWQPKSLCGKLNDSQLTAFDHNIFVNGGSSSKTNNLILWSHAEVKNCQKGYESVDAFNKEFPAFLNKSKFFSNYTGPLFKGKELKNYEILREFDHASSCAQIPTKINKKLEPRKIKGNYIGAYPLIK